MEWITGIGSNEVDIGYVPLMQIVSLSSSHPWVSQPEHLRMETDQESFNDSSIVWDQEIPITKATRKIEQTMYPFKTVSFIALPFLSRVYKLARK